MEEKEVEDADGKVRGQPPTLQELCIKSVAVHLNLFQKLNEIYLPPAAVQSILQYYREEVKQRTSALTDDNIGAYLSLLEAEAFESAAEAGYSNGVAEFEENKAGDGYDHFDTRGNSTREGGDAGTCASIAQDKDQKCGVLETLGLTTLNLPWSASLSCRGCTTIASTCPFLCELDLSYCSLVDDGAVQAIASGCTALELLNLTFCTKVTDKGAKALSTGSKRLCSLSLEECERVTDAGVQKIARSLNIVDLNVGGCKITNVGVSIIASHGKRLRRLVLGGCPSVTDFDLEDISKGCHELEDLGLRACHYVSDKGLRWIAKLAKRQASRSGGSIGNSGTAPSAAAAATITTTVSSGSAQAATGAQGNRSRNRPRTAVFRQCGLLRRLDVGGCTRVSDNGAIAILRAAPYLAELDLRGTSVSGETLAEACAHAELIGLEVASCTGIERNAFQMSRFGQ